MSGSGNGVTVIGPAARRAKWSAWCIALVCGRLFVGRLHEKRSRDDGWERYLSPFYDLVSGFTFGPGGVSEVHRCFPPLALSLNRIDLPSGGYTLWAFDAMSDTELEGMEAQVEVAEEIWKRMQAARSGLLTPDIPGGVDLSKLPPMQKK